MHLWETVAFPNPPAPPSLRQYSGGGGGDGEGGVCVPKVPVLMCLLLLTLCVFPCHSPCVTSAPATTWWRAPSPASRGPHRPTHLAPPSSGVLFPTVQRRWPGRPSAAPPPEAHLAAPVPVGSNRPPPRQYPSTKRSRRTSSE